MESENKSLSTAYELTNHLGNVLSVISDKKIGHSANGTTVDYYNAEVNNQIDYYSFGKYQPGRRYGFSRQYFYNRYGFNGKDYEAENFIIDYGMRFYSPDLGMFFSVDPLTKNFPFYSPYQFAGNSPIRNIDLDGGEPQDFVDNWKPRNIFNPKSGVSNGNTISVYDAKLGRNLSVEGVYDNWTKQTWFIHEDNQGNYYYLKNLNGDNQTLRYTSDPSHTLVGGQFEKFETQDETQRKNVNKFLDDFSLAFAGGITAVAAAPVALEALVPASEYLAPKLGFNAAGAAWDLFNQKVIKGESWENINVASIITAGSFGGGSTFSNALFGSSGSFLNLSYNNISQGKNLLNFNKAGVVGFSSSFAGGLFAGGTSAFFKSANQTAITNPLTRSIMNYVLSNTMEATGQMGANIIESKLSHK